MSISKAPACGPDELDNWYLTEAEGDTIGVFGSSTRFRYLVPWGTVEDCINFLRSRGDHNPGSLVAWATTARSSAAGPPRTPTAGRTAGSIASLRGLEAESHWISTVHLGRWQREHDPKSLVYLPTTSYMEMGEWSLPPGEQHEMERAKAILHNNGGDGLERFFRGGHWRNFLTRYPEVNLLQKRSLHLSRDAHELHNDVALDHIWQAQCNCPFWHGVFGGVYLENIRHANFGHLSMADAELFPGTSHRTCATGTSMARTRCACDRRTNSSRSRPGPGAKSSIGTCASAAGT